MSQFTKEYETFFKSPAGIEFLTFIHNQLDTEHEAAENAEDRDVSYGHSKTAKAYREIEKHITVVQLGVSQS